MFIDASALVAMLLEEDDAEGFMIRVEETGPCFTSAIALFETVLAINRVHAGGIQRARAQVLKFARQAGIDVVPINEDAGTLALDAHAWYGKGSGHPARLNLGDCFAYALAKQHGVPLLYKGDDFTGTDLA